MKICILGAGWLGFPLAMKLKAHHEVLATTTSEEKQSRLQQEGLNTMVVALPERIAGLPSEITNADVLVLSIPPFSRSKPVEYHPNQIRSLLACLPSRTKVLYTSSTSVYPDISETVQEDFPITEANTGHLGIWKAEQAVLQHNSENLIVRLAGLAGYDRFLARHFSGKRDLKNGSWPVNLVHRDDVVAAAVALVQQNKSGIYNICAPAHPTKRELYSEQCFEYGLPAPHYDESDQSVGKLVSSGKLIKDLNYTFQYPNPMDFPYSF